MVGRNATHAGLPWLRYLRQELGGQVHFWLFDGWDIPPGRSASVEASPSLYKNSFAQEDRTPDHRYAYAIAAWMQQVDHVGQLSKFLSPSLSPPPERGITGVEGWILGVG